LHFILVDLGEVDVMENISLAQENYLKGLLSAGFELMDDKKSMLIEKLRM
jgi:hypothetical protein